MDFQDEKQSLRPLDGITVVSLEHAVAAPFAPASSPIWGRA
jgi:crotonobetainyl-CoA:carnitine CoA-transferase CaiB-like acyl-CoA transferase